MLDRSLGLGMVLPYFIRFIFHYSMDNQL